jgi:protoporphyrinogen oxidase
MAQPSVLVLGGGLSGMAAAYAIARAGLRDVTLIERGPELGGLAGTFERDGHFYPLGYHHILSRDRTLLYVLDVIGALPVVRWRKIRMFFRVGGRLYDLADPLDVVRFPMALADKVRFARLMLRSFGKNEWGDWTDHSARELVDRWAGPGVRAALFEPLTRLKFQLPCDEVSGAWLGTRLNFREGSSPLGYIPGTNWTGVLCDGLTRMLIEAGVDVRVGTTARRLHASGDRIREVELADGARLHADVVVSTIPAEVYTGMVEAESTPNLDAIRYTAMISVVAATRQRIAPDFYWMNLISPRLHACGIFLLSSLNPTIGEAGDTCVNFVTHLRSRDDPFFRHSDAELLDAYREDFREIFGFELEPFWTHITRLTMYSPIFVRSYRNPPVRSATWRNVYFAGNHCTFPSVASTGTAMGSGMEAAESVLADLGRAGGLRAEVAGFRLRSMPRG